MAGAMVNDVVNRTAKAASSLVFIGYSPYLVYGYYLPGMTGSVIHQKKMSRSTKQDTNRSIGEKTVFVPKPEFKTAAVEQILSAINSCQSKTKLINATTEVASASRIR
jgi:hypothetical protein